jgi:hypothetical protein
VHVSLPISDIKFTAGSPAERVTGLLGWIGLRYGDLLLDGLALRRTLDGRLVLSFPRPSRRVGLARQLVGPAGPDVRQQIEAEVFAELRRQGAIP